MKSKVFVTHCVDTEGPLSESLKSTFLRLKSIFNIELSPSLENLKKIQNEELDLDGLEKEVAKVFNEKLLAYKKDWSSLDDMLDRIMSPNFRSSYQDSHGNPWIYNWFCLDHFGFESNPRNRDLTEHAVFDHYSARHDLFTDGIYFHHHPVGYKAEAHRCSTNYISHKPYIFEILARKIIDRHWFPSVYRPGFHATRPDSHWFLEQYIPFEFANQSKPQCTEGEQMDLANGRFGDWRRAPVSWEPYNPSHDDYQTPGNCRRLIARCLNVGTRLRLLEKADAELAFTEALAGKNVILSFTNHDFREMSADVEYVHNLLTTLSRKYSIEFVYKNSRDAFREVISSQTANPLKMRVSIQNNNQILIESNMDTFGPQPFLAIKTTSNKYLHENLDTHIPFRKWSYTFDEHSLCIGEIEEIGVASNNKYGSTYVGCFNVPERKLIERVL